MPAEKPKMKSTKPLMEKRRRARINDSLMQLKNLVLDALNKNNPRHSKLEKADILEMTVRYLRTIQRQQISASVNSDPAKLGQYRSGYAECVTEVTRYLGATASTDGAPELRTELVGHLANLCTSSNQQQQQQTSPTRTPSPHHHQQQTPYPQYAIHQQQPLEPVYADTPRDTVSVNRMSPSIEHTATYRNVVSRSPVPEGAQVDYALTTPVYDTQRVRMSPPTTHNSTRVVVSPPLDGVNGLPSGEITLVLPQQALPNGQLPTHFIPVYAQGPVVVTPATNGNTQTVSDVSHHAMSPSSAGNTLPVSPVGACTSPVQQTFTASPVSHHQVQTELSPVSRELYYHKSAAYENQCVSKKDTMWRPW
ncbi:uncharacterized protein [Amphiura filiformis]|uniref:uncharacterized protein n=1 Tax=Amphiura filiformis TaxID=82378 RepID=UPI003B225736